MRTFDDNLKIEAKESITNPLAQEYVTGLETLAGAAAIYWHAREWNIDSAVAESALYNVLETLDFLEG